MSLGMNYSFYCLECCQYYFSCREDCLMCRLSNKVIISGARSCLVLGGLHEDKSCDTFQTMVSTNVKTIHQTPLLHIESNVDRLGLLSPTHGQRSQQQSGQITLQSILINKPKYLKATYHTEIRKIEIPRSMVVDALCWRSRRASHHSAVQSPVHPSKKSP